MSQRRSFFSAFNYLNNNDSSGFSTTFLFLLIQNMIFAVAITVLDVQVEVFWQKSKQGSVDFLHFQQDHQYIAFTFILVSMIVSLACLVLSQKWAAQTLYPIHKFQEHVQRLIDGDFSDRIDLRKYDRFHDIKDELNELTEALAQRKGDKAGLPS